MRIPLTILSAGLMLGVISASAQSPIRVQIANDPATLDPHRLTDLAGLKIMASTFEGLIQYDETGKIRPRLASSFSISPDKKTYVFKVREDVRWSDGAPLLASHFVSGFLRALDPKVGTKFAASLFPIRGAKEVFEGKVPSNTLAVRARDDSGARTLTIELNEPCGYFLHLLTLPVFAPSKTGSDWKVGDPTPGPYFVAERQQDRRILLQPNPHYPSSSSGEKRSPIELLVVSDESTATSLFEAGKIDILTKVSTLDSERLRKSGVVHTNALSATTAILMNPNRTPLDRRDLRQAIARSIDKAGIVRALGGEEKVAHGLIPPGFEGHVKSLSSPRVAPASVRKSPAPALVATYDSSGNSSIILEKIQSDLLKNLSLPLELQGMEWKSYISLVLRDPPPLFRLTYPAWYADPYGYLEIYTSGHPANSLKWSNARYDAIVRQISKLSPGQKRARLVREAQQILTQEEAILVPLFHAQQKYAVSPSLTGFAVNALGVIRFAELTRKK